MFLWLTLFAQEKIDVQKMPMHLWQKDFQASKGRPTIDFVKWLLTDELKLAPKDQIKVEKDPYYNGQFIVYDHEGYIIFFVRDFPFAENAEAGDFTEKTDMYISKSGEAESKNIGLIKKVFGKSLRNRHGVGFKEKDGLQVIFELERKVYTYFFSENVPLVGTQKKEKNYLVITHVKNQGQRLKELLDKPAALEILETVGKAVGAFHKRFRQFAKINPFSAGFYTITHGDLHIGNIMYDPKTKTVTFLNNNQMADIIKSGGKSNLLDVKTLVKDLTDEQQKAFFKGYTSVFSSKFNYNVEALEQFMKSKEFENLH